MSQRTTASQYHAAAPAYSNVDGIQSGSNSLTRRYLPHVVEQRQSKTMSGLPAPISNAYAHFNGDDNVENFDVNVVDDHGPGDSYVDHNGYYPGHRLAGTRPTTTVYSDSEYPPRDVTRRYNGDIDIATYVDVAYDDTAAGRNSQWILSRADAGPPTDRSRVHYVQRLDSCLRRRQRMSGSLRKKYPRDLARVLDDLHQDLLENDSYVAELMSSQQRQQHVLSMLVELLCDIQTNRTLMTSSTHRHSNDLLRAMTTDERNLLICIKLIVENEANASNLLFEERTTEALVFSALSLNELDPQSSIIALQILALCCDGPRAQNAVLRALSLVSLNMHEPGRFDLLVNLIISSYDYDFVTACLRLLNKLCETADGLSAQIHVQQDLALAGFSADSLDLLSTAAERNNELDIELQAWRSMLTDVSDNIYHQQRRRQAVYYQYDDDEQQYENQENQDVLRRQIIELQRMLEESEAELAKWHESAERWTASGLEWQQAEAQLVQDRDEYWEMVLRERQSHERLKEMYRARVRRDPDEDLQYFDMPGDVTDSLYAAVDDVLPAMGPSQSLSMQQRDYSMSAGAVAVSYLSESMRRKVVDHDPLPLLNWTTMKDIRATVFEDADFEAVLRRLDFSDFEEQFRLPVRRENAIIRQRRDEAIRLNSERIHFVEKNRAKNLIITQKKTNLTPLGLREAIDVCDIQSLPGDHAELLAKFTPTRDELNQMDLYCDQYANMDEAEQILFNMAQVERLESKLNLMTYMGQFDELVKSLKPNISRLLTASLTVCNSVKLKKIFEIILAIGNYVNSSRRGFVLGFKLDALAKVTDVRSREDKNINLLHFIVHVVHTEYPELAQFYDEIDLDVDKNVSYQAISSGMQTLKQGNSSAQYELSQQPDNELVATFYADSSPTVATLSVDFDNMAAAYRSLCALFGENFRLVEPPEVFGQLVAFVASFKKSADENYGRQHPPEVVVPRAAPRRSNRKRLKSAPQPEPEVVRLRHVPRPDLVRRLTEGGSSAAADVTPSTGAYEPPTSDAMVYSEIDGDDAQEARQNALQPQAETSASPVQFPVDNFYEPVTDQHEYEYVTRHDESRDHDLDRHSTTGDVTVDDITDESKFVSTDIDKRLIGSKWPEIDEVISKAVAK